jgi:hypothetical protein
MLQHPQPPLLLPLELFNRSTITNTNTTIIMSTTTTISTLTNTKLVTI